MLTPYLPQRPELVEELVDEVTKSSPTIHRSSHPDGTIENLEVSKELADELANDPNYPGSSEDIKRGHIQCMLRDHPQLPRITQHVVNNPKLVERLVNDSQLTLPLEDDSMLIRGIKYTSKPFRRDHARRRLFRYLVCKPTLAQEIAKCLNLPHNVVKKLDLLNYKLVLYKLDQCLEDKPALARDIAENLKLARDIANNPELARYKLAQYKLARCELGQCLKDNLTLTQNIAKNLELAQYILDFPEVAQRMLDNFDLFQDMDANHKASDSQLARKMLANTELVDCIQYESFSKDIARHKKLIQDILRHKYFVQKVVNNMLTSYLHQKPEFVEELVDEVTKLSLTIHSSSHPDGTIENLEVSKELVDELANDPNCPGSSEDIKRGHIQCMLRDHFQLPRITQHIVNNPKLVERLVNDSQFTLPLEDDSVLIQGIEYNSIPVRRYRAWQKLVRYLEGKPTLAQEIAKGLNLSPDIARNLELSQYKVVLYKLDQCLKDKPTLALDIAENLELASGYS